MMAAIDEFHVVTRRRGKRSTKQINTSGSITQTEQGDESFDIKVFQKRLNDCMQELLLSDFFQATYDAIITALSAMIESKTERNTKPPFKKTAKSNGCYQAPCPTNTFTVDKTGKPPPGGIEDSEKIVIHPVDLLCYGIGRFSTCPIARYQLAFLLVMKEKLEHPPCHVYDPVFTSQEKTMLEGLGCSLIDTNEEGKRVFKVPTVAFLPHCGKALYNNLIWKNLSTPGHEGIHNLVLVGNSFSSMIERTPERQLLKTANYVKKIHSQTMETPLPVHTPHSDIFNDLAIHTFPLQNFESLPAEHSADNPEPTYDEEDAEMIMNKAT